MIMAENAVIRFNQSNQLVVTNAAGVVQAGITGGEDGILIWSGGKPARLPSKFIEMVLLKVLDLN